jgi:putative ABC transport system substrate-binding protein
VVSGLVGSLAHPGGNLTGLTVLGHDLAGNRLELLKESYPESLTLLSYGIPRVM